MGYKNNNFRLNAFAALLNCLPYMTFVKSGRFPCFRQYHAIDDLNSDKRKVSAKRKLFVVREITAYIASELHTLGKKI